MNNAVYFEDFSLDADWETVGTTTLNKDEIISFASIYDPQPMHLDEEAGKASILGGLAASGWHTGALLIGMMVKNVLTHTKNYGSPGVKAAHWLAPVYIGDTLSVRYKINSMRRSQSKPHMGLIDFFIEAQNQNDVVVMTMVSTQFIGLSEGAHS